MWGDGAYGEVAYAESADGTIPPFQDRRVFAGIAFVADGAGAFTAPVPGQAEIVITASGAGLAIRTKVKVIKTSPGGGRGKTGLSHTGLN